MAAKAAETAALEADISNAEANRLAAVARQCNTPRSFHVLYPKWSRSDEIKFYARVITNDEERKAFKNWRTTEFTAADLEDCVQTIVRLHPHSRVRTW